MANQATNQKQSPKTDQLAIVKRDTVDVVAGKIREFQEKGELHFPDNYSPDNAMKAAWLKLQEITDKNGIPALQCTTRDSIANALLTMVVYGLTPLKDQGYFIVYGKKLLWQNSYFGNIALWKRVTKSNIDPVAVVVYADDEFEYEIVNGEYHITKHKQSLKNIDDSKIVAAYAILTYPDGTTKTTFMTMDQIRKAWEQGQTKGNSPAHKNFPAEMSKKTVLNRACKVGIKSSDDSSLKLIKEIMKANEEDIAEAAIEAEIEENANTELIDVEYEVSDVESEPEPEPTPEPKPNNPAQKSKIVQQSLMDGEPY